MVSLVQTYTTEQNTTRTIESAVINKEKKLLQKTKEKTSKKYIINLNWDEMNDCCVVLWNEKLIFQLFSLPISKVRLNKKKTKMKLRWNWEEILDAYITITYYSMNYGLYLLYD